MWPRNVRIAQNIKSLLVMMELDRVFPSVFREIFTFFTKVEQGTEMERSDGLLADL